MLGKVPFLNIMDTLKIQTPGFWRAIDQPHLGLMNSLGQEINRMNIVNPYLLPDIRESPTLVITSDYSGEHLESPYQIISFLVAGLDMYQEWSYQREYIRKVFLGEKRRMSYKDLRDKKRQRSLIPFLIAANSIRGLCVTIAIKKSVDTLFNAEVPLDLKNPDFTNYQLWPKKTLEKAFRIIHFICLFVSRMSRPLQNVFWFTDQDDIAANDNRVIELTNIFGWVLSEYLNSNLGHIRCGTTKCDDGSRIIEDLASVPDLVAGAFGDMLLNKERLNINISADEIVWWKRGDIKDKSGLILNWYADSNYEDLKKIACIISEDTDKKLLISWLNFKLP